MRAEHLIYGFGRREAGKHNDNDESQTDHQDRRAIDQSIVVFVAIMVMLTTACGILLSLLAVAEANLTTNQLHALRRDALYKCELSYLQMDTSLIKFSVEHLLVGRNLEGQERSARVTLRGENFVLEEIDYNSTIEQLHRSTKLNPKLPFLFFINGFNTLNEYGEINGTWMFDVATNLAKNWVNEGDRTPFLYRILERFFSRSVEEKSQSEALQANVIFLTWGIPHLIANNLLSMIPAYYKTVANYDLIMEFVAQTIRQMVRFVEWPRDRWTSYAERAQFYERFHFYGHSLGSHILADALQRVRKTLGMGVKFGRLTGLDPATPCFLSLEHGISASKVENSIAELVVVHSNAGLAGLTNERADIEIVLNGGTFQPGCAWYDLGCHHSRSTDILRYRDDECQLVAYKCSSYHHFKSGACETCDPAPLARRNFSAPEVVRNCVLVNMAEQHRDSAQVLEFAEFNDRVRQLADDDHDYRKFNRSSLRKRTSGRGRPVARADDERARKSFYHFVNTSPNFRSGRKSHCLQHYQLRLIVFHENGGDKRVEQRCRPSSYYTIDSNLDTDSPSGQLNLKLFYELEPEMTELRNGTRMKELLPEESKRVNSIIQLNAIIKDLLHTALLTSERAPKLFVGALVDNLNVRALAQCYERENATSGPNFVLDIAFMSHTNAKVRHAFSSILCGKVELKTDTTTNEQQQQQLMLGLCKQSELSDVSAQIDKLLDQIRLQRLDESWKVSLLNNLFSLFTEWEPF